MLVKYIKSGPSGKIGDIRDHDPAQARVLIKLGIAVAVDQSSEPKRTAKRGVAFGNLPLLSADPNATIPEKKAPAKRSSKRSSRKESDA